MTTFTMIVLIAFVACLAWQLMAAAQKSCIRLEIMFAAEILMFAYRRKTFFEKLVDKVCNKWYNKTKGD